MGWRKFGIEIINFHFLKNKNYDYLLSQNFQNKIKKKQLNDLLTVCVFFFYKHNLFSISKKITLLRIKEIEKEFGKNHINTIKINIRLENIYLNNSDLDHDKLIKATNCAQVYKQNRTVAARPIVDSQNLEHISQWIEKRRLNLVAPFLSSLVVLDSFVLLLSNSNTRLRAHS